MVIGRNSPCPCMSGERFKNCCGVSGVWEDLETNGLYYYDESFALKVLLSKDKTFHKYYFSERQKIRKRVYFLQSNNLQSSASFGIYDDGYMIVNKHPQVKVEDSIHVAHEIGHLVLCSEGYKHVRFKNLEHNNKSIMHKNLNDMVYDPIINERLLKSDFDLESYLTLSDSIQMKITGNNPAGLFLLMTLFVKRVLDFRNINPNISPDAIIFNKMVIEKHPQLVHQSRRILEIIDESGFKTSQEAEASLIEIINYLELKDLFYLNCI
ncbi:SEC-C metal-binding domain-containing protein [Peribacillus frigoritolerans]|uniref:YecA family protein n=1 Tax=Peribacillus frigoritolerans TaxID=450367 RepID=UPI003ECD1B14